ncbi:MAG: hypothetical protein COW73_04215 [Nitrospirae bacterium CG18_big_fil_WC_8_21_14_2_50_70_55]|nr:hypothetical protein [Deltaproteobacteria bacterium]OIP66930.1 MAG: hypothetical protein AUK30_01395 [Nitrospirae bacterium CG2_30_70_394]PIQ05986.1 MAG: hypothetical protein COW73_04215 [Nitrospirae bacterium CG18_big_fil_WC_8_21_14_2_50_70_55]
MIEPTPEPKRDPPHATPPRGGRPAADPTRRFPAPCGHPRAPLSLFLDGEAGLLLSLRLRWRLARCGACRAALAELAGADRLAAALAMAVDPAAEQRLLARARALAAPVVVAPARRPRLRVALPVAASVALVVVAAVVGERLFAPPPESTLVAELPLFEEMELIAELDLVRHLHEVEEVRLD